MSKSIVNHLSQGRVHFLCTMFSFRGLQKKVNTLRVTFSVNIHTPSIQKCYLIKVQCTDCTKEFKQRMSSMVFLGEHCSVIQIELCWKI